MKNKAFRYRVLVDEKPTGLFPSEQEALMFVRRSSQRNRTAKFVIEQVETIFDFEKVPVHAILLAEFRKERIDNAIHASIHAEEWDIGRDDLK